MGLGFDVPGLKESRVFFALRFASFSKFSSWGACTGLGESMSLACSIVLSFRFPFGLPRPRAGRLRGREMVGD
jgi:hypothetical protein